MFRMRSFTLLTRKMKTLLPPFHILVLLRSSIVTPRAPRQSHLPAQCVERSVVPFLNGFAHASQDDAMPFLAVLEVSPCLLYVVLHALVKPDAIHGPPDCP